MTAKALEHAEHLSVLVGEDQAEIEFLFTRVGQIMRTEGQSRNQAVKTAKSEWANREQQGESS